jgi:hypothetical protein
MLDFLAVYGKNNREINSEIISHLTEKPIEYATFAYQNANYIVSPKHDRLFLFATDKQQEKILGYVGDRLSFFDGNITQSEFLTDIRRLSPLLGSCETDHSDIFGIYCYGEISELGENYIHHDVLGNYPLFIAYNDNLTAISNNPYLAAQALYGVNWRLYKNIYALGNIVMNGEIADNEMTFKGVYYVPQNAGVIVNKNNSVSFYSMINNMYYPMSDEEWNGRLEAVHKQMINFLRSYAADGAVGGNITGGFDSRVLLALTIEAGIHQNVFYSIMGYEDHPDVIIARQIAEYFGLNLTRIDSAVQNIDEDVIKVSFERTLGQYASTVGTVSFNERWMGGINGIYQQKKQIKTARNLLAGISIEQCRGYLSLHLFDKGIANKSIGKEERNLLLSDRITGIERYTKKANEYFAKSYNRAIDSFEELYAADLLLNRIRLPQFHGGLSRKNSNWFCTIGYNSWLHRLAMIQAPEKRAATDIPFRLIEKSVPDLLYFPFDSKSWKYTTFAHRVDAERFLQISPVENIANRPLPSSSNIINQIRFLFENNIELDNSVFEVFDEKWIHNRIAEAKLQITGKKPVVRWQLIPIVDIYGTSLFMQSKEGNLSDGCTIPSLFCAQNLISQIKPLYMLNKNWYTEPAEQVLKNGELCFERHKVFRQSDHNRLSNSEKFIFALDIEYSKSKIKLNEIEKSRQWYISTKKQIEVEKNVLKVECDKMKSNFIK